jgi:hypothetical protein
MRILRKHKQQKLNEVIRAWHSGAYYNPSTRESGAEESQVLHQPKLHTETSL